MGSKGLITKVSTARAGLARLFWRPPAPGPSGRRCGPDGNLARPRDA